MVTQSPDLTVMIKAAEKAARDLIRDFGEVEQLQVSQKGPGDFVSAADRRAEETIYEVLKHARPNFGFLMEESKEIAGKGNDDNKRFIIDPLDGTTNFLHGIPHWAISIALEVDGEVTVGLVYDPVKDEMFTAEKGQGAFLRRKRLRVSGRRDLMMSTIACGAPRRALEKQQKFLDEYKAVLNVAPGIRRFGAAALDLAYVAAGRYEGFWERDLKAWDIAAGILIVREAGGYAKDVDTENRNPVLTGSVLAANTDIYTELKKIIKNA